MNEYFKKIILSFAPDKKSLDTISNSLGSSIEVAFKDSAIGKTLAEGFNSMLKGENPLKTTLDIAIKEFAKIVNGGIDDLSDILEFSQLSTSETRDLAFTYGFSSSQAFGYTKALEAVGLGSMDDLMYANQQEQAQFRDAFSKYTERYDELYDSGFFSKMQEYQFEMQNFKNDMQLEVVQFFMDNKAVISDAMTAIIKMSDAVLTGFSWLIDFFDRDRTRTSSERSAATADIINSYSTSRSTNVKIDNTFNNVSKSDQTWLANAGSMTYEQVIKALT